jgi:hypothetical protein
VPRVDFFWALHAANRHIYIQPTGIVMASTASLNSRYGIISWAHTTVKGVGKRVLCFITFPRMLRGLSLLPLRTHLEER